MNQETLSATELGVKGVEYVKTELSKGDDLANLLLANQAIDRGRVVVYLPSTIEAEELNIREGSLSAEDFDGLDPRKPIVEIAFGFLKADPHHIFVAEMDPLPPEYEVRNRSPLGSFVRNPGRRGTWKDVYSYLTSDLATDPYIRLLTAHARGYPRVMCLTSMPTPLDINSVPEVKDDFLAALARMTEFIFVGAYDECAIVIWRKPD